MTIQENSKIYVDKTDIEKMKKTIWGISLVGTALALLIGFGMFGAVKLDNYTRNKTKPTIKSVRDVTGDGIEDIIVEEELDNRKYLFIGQKDGNYIRTEKKYSPDRTEYFKAENGGTYFFDGKIYIKSPPQTK